MMQQSHRGLTPSSHYWDRLAIIVDKSQTPKRARFFQLEPGELAWHPRQKRQEFRVSCFICHANGPRAIRALSDSQNIKLSLLDQARIQLWNFRIKAYGRVTPDPAHDREDEIAKVPFRARGRLDNFTLSVAACTKCHRDSGPFARGSLTRQNALTIDFMVSTGQMPPLWFRLTPDDRKAIQAFIAGF